MKITKKKVKEVGCEFCFTCGCTLKKEKYIINLGTDGSTFEFCKHCLKSIKDKTERVLI